MMTAWLTLYEEFNTVRNLAWQALLAAIRQQYRPLGGKKTESHHQKMCAMFYSKTKRLRADHGKLTRSPRSTKSAFSIPRSWLLRTFLLPIWKKKQSINGVSYKPLHMLYHKGGSNGSREASINWIVSSCIASFFCTCGKPMVIWSDKATNFVGAKN